MPLLIDTLQVLALEIRKFKGDHLPPMLSYIIAVSTFIVSFIFAVFILLPFLLRVASIRLVLALIISFIAFWLIYFILGELAIVVFKWFRSSNAE